MIEDRRERALRLQEMLEPAFLASLRAAMAAAIATERDVAEAFISLALARLAMLDAQVRTEQQIQRAWGTVAVADEAAPDVLVEPEAH